MTPTPPRYYRRVLRIKAEDSPNVRLAQEQERMGMPVTGEIVTPGVLTWEEYQKRRSTWDAIRQCVGLDAEFYEGAQLLLYPREWLALAASPDLVARCRSHPTEAIGIDPAEGGDSTTFAAVNRYGLKDLTSQKTPDTNSAYHQMKEFILSHHMGEKCDKVCLDRGGGGKEHADRLRAGGLRVRTVAFGESLVPEPRHGRVMVAEKREQREEHYAYKNRRVEMYGLLRLFLDPGNFGNGVGDLVLPSLGFALPGGNVRDPNCPYAELQRQLEVFPLQYDDESRMTLPPKTHKNAQGDEADSLTSMIGHSPDEADALVLGVYGLTSKKRIMSAGTR